MHLVSMHLFGQSLALPDFPQRPDLCGVGLSDWLGYAKRLGQKISYQNTYYHQKPFLDITRIPQQRWGSCDFVISSDVFEHVLPPVQLAFEGARALLKPGGALIMSVPFMIEESETREHFPHLHKFEIADSIDKQSRRLHNIRKDGTEEWFDDLNFHGGPGSTLEMRLFARDGLERTLYTAGFKSVRFCGDDFLPAGIHWPDPWSVPIVAVA